MDILKTLILVGCFLPLIIIYIVLKLAVWVEAVNAEQEYVRKEPSRQRGPYLENVYGLQNSFFQIYSERARTIYGMDFTEIYRDKSINSEYAEVYDAIKRDFPMAISIAED